MWLGLTIIARKIPSNHRWNMIFSVLIQGVSQKKKVLSVKAGGGYQKNFPGHQKEFSGHIRKYSIISHNFRKIQKFFHTISKFSRFFYVLPEFHIDCCPTVKISGGTCQFSSRPSWESPLATSIGKSPSNGQYMG
jgi:hypothetical protein